MDIPDKGSDRVCSQRSENSRSASGELGKPNWYRPKASTCRFGLAALAISLICAPGYVVMALVVPVGQIGHSGLWASVMGVVIVGSGICPLIILLSFALDRVVLPAVVAVGMLVGFENLLLPLMPLWTFMIAMNWTPAALVYVCAWPIAIALVIVRVVKHPRAGLLRG